MTPSQRAEKSSKQNTTRLCWHMLRWKSGILGAVTGSTGSAERDRASGGLEKGRRDGECDAAGRRIRPEVVSGLRGGSGGAREKNGKARESGLEPRRRHKV